MADVVLKNQFGKDVVYRNVDSVSLNTETGETATFVSESFIQPQAQSDWLENDETSGAYIKNRPFGEVYSTILDYIFEDTKDSEGNWSGECGAWDPSDATLVAGKTYTVVWNGEEYVCECAEFAGLPTIGNLSVVGGENNNLPFAIARDINGTLFGVSAWVAIPVVFSDNGLYSCTISGYAIQKIESKYIYQPNWNEHDKLSGSYILNKPFGDFYAGTVVAPEESVNLSFNFDTETYFTAIRPIDIIDGALYDVEFDGIVYTVTGLVNQNQSSLEYKDDNIHFVIANNFYNTGISVVVSTPGEHTYKVTLAEDAVKKIDLKYIPEIKALPEVDNDDNDKTLAVNNGEWTVQMPKKELPDVSANDNGKILQVNNGSWSAMAALPVVLTMYQYNSMLQEGKIDPSVLYMIARENV